MRRAHRILVAVLVLLAAAAVTGMVLLWPPAGGPPTPAAPDPAAGVAEAEELKDGRILAVEQRAVADEFAQLLLPGATVVELTVELEATGEEVTFEATDDTGATFAVGQRVRLARLELPGVADSWYVSDFQRERPLWLLGLLFAVAVVGFGRWQGVRALVGLGLTLLLVVGFVVPAILAGRDPVLVALSAGVAIMLLTLHLVHGVGPKTTAAAVGTAGALFVTVALAASFVGFAELTGFSSEEARLANVEFGGLPLRGLLLAGIIIGALGVLDDVTMSQSATVFALRRANPSMGWSRLTAEALSVGRDHVAATVNTLFLAYAGAALPLLILFTTSALPASEVLTTEIVAVEVVRTLVGSLGIIAAVPLTTVLAAFVAGSGDGDAAASDASDAAAPEPAAPEPAAPELAAPEPAALQPAAPQPAAPQPAGPEVDEAASAEADWVTRLRGAYGLEPAGQPTGGDGPAADDGHPPRDPADDGDAAPPA